MRADEFWDSKMLKGGKGEAFRGLRDLLDEAKRSFSQPILPFSIQSVYSESIICVSHYL